MSFLKAEWRKLVIANYVVDKELLSEFLPKGTQLDFRNKNCYLSVVGFMFKNTKVLGIKIPFHVNFEEVNLRFYVKRTEGDVVKRGVVFVKEIVPKPAITLVANTIYNENYQTLPMKHYWLEKAGKQIIEYHWGKDYAPNKIRVEATNTPTEIEVGSETEFITEHYWGYAKVSQTKTNEYEVTHQRWEKYEVLNYKIDIDFGFTYGEKFRFLNKQKPVSVMLAEGSEITVEKKRSLV